MRCPCSFWYFQNIIIYCHELFKETIICQLTTCTLGNMDSIKEYFSRKSHLIFEGGGRVHIQDCCVHPSDTPLCSQKNSSTKNFIWSKNWIAISEFHANHLLTMQICERNLESYVTKKKNVLLTNICFLKSVKNIYFAYVNFCQNISWKWQNLPRLAMICAIWKDTCSKLKM